MVRHGQKTHLLSRNCSSFLLQPTKSAAIVCAELSTWIVGCVQVLLLSIDFSCQSILLNDPKGQFDVVDLLCVVLKSASTYVHRFPIQPYPPDALSLCFPLIWCGQITPLHPHGKQLKSLPLTHNTQSIIRPLHLPHFSCVFVYRYTDQKSKLVRASWSFQFLPLLIFFLFPLSVLKSQE